MAMLDTVNALITLDEAKDFLGSAASEDDLVQKIINQASWRANKEAARNLVARNYTGDDAEYYNGDGTVTLLVRNYPINSITAIYQDSAREWGTDTLIDSDSYCVDPELEGRIYFTDTTLTIGIRTIKLEYNGGFQSVPWDLREAVLELVQYWYREKADKRVGVASRSLEGRSTSYTHKIPADILDSFWNHRRVTVL